GPQRHALAALVGEVVHLLLHDVGGLAGPLGEKLLVLDDRRAHFDIPIPLAPVARGAFDELPLLDFAGKDVAGAANGRGHAGPPAVPAAVTDSPPSTARSSPHTPESTPHRRRRARVGSCRGCP